jgi:hypothetical protein
MYVLYELILICSTKTGTDVMIFKNILAIFCENSFLLKMLLVFAKIGPRHCI